LISSRQKPTEKLEELIETHKHITYTMAELKEDNNHASHNIDLFKTKAYRKARRTDRNSEAYNVHHGTNAI
jgi:hypothetical protein